MDASQRAALFAWIANAVTECPVQIRQDVATHVGSWAHDAIEADYLNDAVFVKPVRLRRDGPLPVPPHLWERHLTPDGDPFMETYSLTGHMLECFLETH